MAAIGSKILAGDYNEIYNLVNETLGIGSGLSGYGQVLNASTLTPTTKIRKSQWDLLRQDILRIAAHQGLSENPSWTAGITTSIPTLTLVSTTTKLTAGITSSYLNAINVLRLPANRFNLAFGQYSDELLISSSRSTSWNRTIRHFFTIDFGTAENARYFFNAGGTIRINPSFVKTVADTINNDWDNLINGVGTLIFGYDDTKINTSQVSSIGFYDLTNTATQIYTRTGGTQNSLYAVNDYTVRLYCNTSNNSNGTARYIYVECEFKDDKTVNPNIDENVQGTVTNNVRMYRPSGSNVSINAPTATATVNLSDAQI